MILNRAPISIEPLSFDLLAYLVINQDRVVGRAELLDKLWSGKIVTDSALAARLKDVRKAVGDNGRQQSVIKTIHGRGYQFVAQTTVISSTAATGINEEKGSSTSLSLPDKPSIAVLPFQNLSNDVEQDYFSDGMTEDIITALSKIKNLMVVAKTSTSNYEGKSVDVRQVGREQGVRYVLEGSVRKLGNRIRVNAQLVDAINGEHLWAERYDRELQDIFAVQDDLTREIVVALDVELVEGEQARIWSSGTKNFEAWECVRLATFDTLYLGNPEVKKQARERLERAIQLDPSYTIAWVMLGWLHQQYVDVASLASDSADLDNSLASMLDCAQKAIAVDPFCAEAFCLLAFYYLETKSYDAAFENAQKSIALAPNSANNLVEASMIMNKTGHPQRALELIKRAMRICPMYRPGFLRGLGLSYYLLGDYQAAIEAYEKSVERESEYLSAHTMLAIIYSELGDLDNSRRVSDEIIRLSPNFSTHDYMAGIAFRDGTILQRMEEGLISAGLPA